MLVVNREEFLSKLQMVQAGLSSKEIIQQSDCFVFEDGMIRTFNDEISCTVKSGLKDELNGAVQALPLINVLSKLSNENLEFRLTESELIIKASSSEEVGLTLQKEITLAIPEIPEPKKWIVLPEGFGEAVEMIVGCAGKDETKFSLTCVHIGREWIEASDNFQIARVKMELGLQDQFLVRRDSIKHLSTLGMTKVSEAEAWIHFKNPSGLILSCRRYLEKYPDFSSVLARKGSPATLPKNLEEVISKAEIFSSQDIDNNNVIVELYPGKMKLRGIGTSGWYRKSMKVPGYKGDKMTFAIAPKLLTEISKRSNDCVICEDALKIKFGKLTYVTALEDKAATQKDKGDES